MKIIDLLNMIAEGKEVPKKIKYVKYNYEAYTYDNDIKDYISDRGNYGLFATATLTHILNDTVEIIEKDNNKIEKLKKTNFTRNQKKIANKVNEIIEILNNMEE